VRIEIEDGPISRECEVGADCFFGSILSCERNDTVRLPGDVLILLVDSIGRLIYPLSKYVRPLSFGITTAS
jgi:hypothetical protein